MEIERVVEILQENKGVGSGYFISSRLVLTARHVVTPTEPGAPCFVHPIAAVDAATLPLDQRNRPRRLAARVAWLASSDPLVDLAILELADGEAAPAFRSEPVPLGRAPADCGRLACEGRGFPAAAGVDDRYIEGALSWSHVPNRFDIDLLSMTPQLAARWGGMSGSPIFVGELLVGVVSRVDGNWIGGKLEATPVERLEKDPSLSRFLAERALELDFHLACRSRLAPGWLAPTHLAALLLLLAQEPPPKEILRQLYRICLPPTAAQRSGGSLRSMVEHLADMPPPADGGPPPLCRFIREIADRGPALRPGLAEWLRKIGAGRHDLALDAPAPGRPKEHIFYVVVMLGAQEAPLDDAAEACTQTGRCASIRVFKDDDLQPLNEYDWESDIPVASDSVRAALAATLTKLNVWLSNRKDQSLRDGVLQFHIEFCLPHALLAEAFDEWPIPHKGSRQIPVGALHPVALRDIERTVDLDSRRLWADRWERLRQHPPLLGEEPFWVHDRENMSVDQLGEALREPEDDVESPFCIGLGFALEADWLGPGDRDFLFAAWDAGLPAAVWFRAPPQDAGAVDALWRELTRGALMQELPRRLQEERAKAHKDGRALGVGLVWDDPGHVHYCTDAFEGHET
jgi:hypothetical protein